MRTLPLMAALAVLLALVSMIGTASDRIGIEAGAGIDEVSLADSIQDVELAWGEPDWKVDLSYGGIYSWSYSWWEMAVTVVFSDTEQVVGIIATEYPLRGSVYWGATQEGLMISDPREKVVELYGEPEEEDWLDLSDRYVFDYPSRGLKVTLSGLGNVHSITVYAPSPPDFLDSQRWGKIKAAF